MRAMSSLVSGGIMRLKACGRTTCAQRLAARQPQRAGGLELSPLDGLDARAQDLAGVGRREHAEGQDADDQLVVDAEQRGDAPVREHQQDHHGRAADDLHVEVAQVSDPQRAREPRERDPDAQHEADRVRDRGGDEREAEALHVLAAVRPHPLEVGGLG